MAPVKLTLLLLLPLLLIACLQVASSRLMLSKIRETGIEENSGTLQFAQLSYEASVLENSPAGSPVGQVHASGGSGDDSAVRYDLTPSTKREWGESFEIDAQTGLITTKKELDYEYAYYYHLGVAAVDSSQSSAPSAQVRVTVNIGDVNEHAPYISVNNLVGTSDGDVAVEWKYSWGGKYVLQALVYDSDSVPNSAKACSLTYDGDGLFRIKALAVTYAVGEYVVETTRSLGPEDVGQYMVEIFCSDHGTPPMTNSVARTVRVINRQ